MAHDIACHGFFSLVAAVFFSASRVGCIGSAGAAAGALFLPLWPALTLCGLLYSHSAPLLCDGRGCLRFISCVFIFFKRKPQLTLLVLRTRCGLTGTVSNSLLMAGALVSTLYIAWSLSPPAALPMPQVAVGTLLCAAAVLATYRGVCSAWDHLGQVALLSSCWRPDLPWGMPYLMRSQLG